MSDLQQRMAATIGGVIAVDCGHFKSEKDPNSPGGCKPCHEYSKQIAERLMPVVTETLQDGLRWFSEAVTEAAQKSPAPSGAPDLASAYWDGYRAAGREVADLLTEPKLADMAINHRSNDE